MPTLSFESLLSLAVIAALVVCVWRFTSIIAALAKSTARHDERNSEQRDRFFMQLLEQKAVASSAKDAVSMAAVHSREHLTAHGMNLQRDAADSKETAKAARKAEFERQHRERQKTGVTTEAFGQ